MLPCISMEEELSTEVPLRNKQYSISFQNQVSSEKYHEGFALAEKQDHDMLNCNCLIAGIILG